MFVFVPTNGCQRVLHLGTFCDEWAALHVRISSSAYVMQYLIVHLRISSSAYVMQYLIVNLPNNSQPAIKQVQSSSQERWQLLHSNVRWWCVSPNKHQLAEGISHASRNHHDALRHVPEHHQSGSVVFPMGALLDISNGPLSGSRGSRAFSSGIHNLKSVTHFLYHCATAEFHGLNGRSARFYQEQLETSNSSKPFLWEMQIACQVGGISLSLVLITSRASRGRPGPDLSVICSWSEGCPAFCPGLDRDQAAFCRLGAATPAGCASFVWRDITWTCKPILCY